MSVFEYYLRGVVSTMSPIFLSESEVHQLTGRLRPKAQCTWLLNHGWKFTVNALGKPIVATAEVEQRLLGNAKLPTGNEPNWGALNG